MTLVAEEADGSNIGASFEVVKRRLGQLKDYCSQIGRDVNSIRISGQFTPFLAQGISDANKAARMWAEYCGADLQRLVSSDRVWVGTAEDVTPGLTNGLN